MAGADYSYEGLKNLWIKNGGPPEWADTMAAIALAGESGGSPTIQNASGATGIWQILSSAQSAAFNAKHPASTMKDPNANARAAIELLGNGSGVSNWEADPIGAAIVANGSKPLTPQQAQQYATQGAPANATLDAAMTGPSSSNGGVTAGAQAPRKPMAGVNLNNFHGYDLTQIPKDQLGDVEYGIQTYITNPNQQITTTTYDAQGNPTGDLSSSIKQRLQSDYGYGSWTMNNKELAPIMLGAVVNGWDENTFTGAMTATNWYKTTSESQRDWQITQSTDPAKANSELAQAQEKVLAVENQSGIKLSAAQVAQISHTVAANSGTQTGVLGSEAGMTQEQIEQLVVKASNLTAQTGGGANTDSLGGIAGQLLNQFKTVAQQYLMYDPANPTKGLLSDQSLMSQVQSAMQKYTGSGSFGSSNLINGAVADFTQQMVEQSSRLYPSLATAIQSGTKPQDYIAPLTNYVAQQTGMSQGQVNVLDPQWNWIISSPGKDGVLGPVTQDQALQKITDPGFSWSDPNGKQMNYMATNAGQQIQNQFSQSFASAFGKSA